MANPDPEKPVHQWELPMTVAKQQIDAIYFTALRVTDDAQRGSFLEQACAGDDTLHAAVTRMLGAHSAAEDFFANSAPALTLTLEDFAVTETEDILAESTSFDERLGSRIDHYRLLQRLGEGGCGVVYLAGQEEPIRRRVAIKIIKLGMDTHSVIARFEAERQALAMMDHPNIARVLDAGATGAGRPYFVMEWVGGGETHRLLRPARSGYPAAPGLVRAGVRGHPARPSKGCDPSRHQTV